MHEFRVWAPRPKRVDLLVRERRLRMEPLARGWWRLAVDDAAPGTDYAFSLDDGPPRPDPRSALQPLGIDGPSRLIDHSAFEWTGPWLARDGALRRRPLRAPHRHVLASRARSTGAIEHLEHLVALGVDFIELMPVAEFSGRRGWGYDGVDLFAPHHAYGGADGLKRLIDACHCARPGSGDGRRLQPPRPGRKLPCGVRSLLLGSPPNALGRRRELRRAGQRRGARASSSTMRSCGYGTITATACGSMPCTRSSTNRLRTFSRSWPP